MSKRFESNPDRKLRQIHIHEIYLVQDLELYLGIVRVPYQRDYCSSSLLMSVYSVTKGLSRNRVFTIWHNLLVQGTINVEDHEVSSSEDDASEQQKREGESRNVWFEKAKLIVDYVREISTKSLSWPGMCICIDKQMVRCRKEVLRPIGPKTSKSIKDTNCSRWLLEILDM